MRAASSRLPAGTTKRTFLADRCFFGCAHGMEVDAVEVPSATESRQEADRRYRRTREHQPPRRHRITQPHGCARGEVTTLRTSRHRTSRRASEPPGLSFMDLGDWLWLWERPQQEFRASFGTVEARDPVLRVLGEERVVKSRRWNWRGAGRSIGEISSKSRTYSRARVVIGIPRGEMQYCGGDDQTFGVELRTSMLELVGMPNERQGATDLASNHTHAPTIRNWGIG